MPAYTILIMKRNETDRRPLTLHISAFMFWAVIGLAVALPIVGFGVSVGWIAPAWVKLDFSTMEQRVHLADKALEENSALQQQMDDLKKQIDKERAAHAEAETKVTMAETARVEATTKMTQMEAELITLKRSVATYEQMLKPKLARELLQCVNLDAKLENGTVRYSTSFAKISQNMKLPNKLTARVRVVVGDNAMTMQSDTAKNLQVSHVLDAAKGLDIKGTLALDISADATRLLDVKVFDDANKPVAYCWKTF